MGAKETQGTLIVRVANSKQVEYLMFLCVVVSCGVMAIETPTLSRASRTYQVTSTLDYVTTGIFTAEALLKVRLPTRSARCQHGHNDYVGPPGLLSILARNAPQKLQGTVSGVASLDLPRTWRRVRLGHWAACSHLPAAAHPPSLCSSLPFPIALAGVSRPACGCDDFFSAGQCGNAPAQSRCRGGVPQTLRRAPPLPGSEGV